ncbi:MAG: LarC family nickel insertion protein [Synergistes sp.]|nr:LarC family nickel insertion protein [Synergistes sp.]
MRTLYLDCGMGAAGDMMSAALLELCDNRDKFIEKINSIGIPYVNITANECKKCGISGTAISVKIHGEEECTEEKTHTHTHCHSHTHICDVWNLISSLDIPETIRKDITDVYTLIADAESRVHGVPADLVHFHEVGAMDAVADIAMTSMLIAELAPARIAASPVHVGAGYVKCAHGILPVPAPATAELLRGIPIYGGEIASELCTPTGAALLKHFVTEFVPLPLMRIEKIGYGMGKKDFDRANCIRAILGECE